MHPAVAALLTYIGVAICFQFVGFLISQGVDLIFPMISMMVFLLCFIASMFLAWPAAVYIVERFLPGAKSEPVPASRI